jgi:CDP-diacylglycerol--glycerol-3-phosphate 3-phosphatidyltransferase
VIKSVFGHRLDPWVRRLLPFLFRRPVNPNLLTVLGTSVSLAAAVAFAAGWFLTAGLLMLAGGLCDLVDGVVARYHGVSTRFGAFLDSTLDRLSDMALLLGIAMHFALGGEPRLVLLAGYTLVVTVLVSYAQARAEIAVPSFRVGVLERAERILILAVGALSGYVILALWIIAIGSTITVVQRFARAYREMERIDAAERASLEGNT